MTKLKSIFSSRVKEKRVF